jgi:hypothetical protein
MKSAVWATDVSGDENRMDLRWILRGLELEGESGSPRSDVQRPVWKVKTGTYRNFHSGRRLSKTIFQKVIFQNLFFIALCCRFLREGRGMYRFLLGKLEGKRPLGRTRRRWEDNIKMNSQEVGCGDIDWMELVQDGNSWPALANAVSGVPRGVGGFKTPRNFEILTKLSRIPSSVENTSITT